MWNSPKSVQNEEQNDRQGGQSSFKLQKKVNSKRKLVINPKIHDLPRNSSFSSSSLATSYLRANSHSDPESNPIRSFDYSNLGMPHFSEKYLPRGAPVEQLSQEMAKVIELKQSEIQTLRVYRDELKFISFYNPYYSPAKLSLKSLRSKAQIETQINEQKDQLEREIKQWDWEAETMAEYTEHIKQFFKDQDGLGDLIDIGQEQEIMTENKKMETAQILKELQQQKRKGTKEIRAIQQQIQSLRILIQEKEDLLRNKKSKLCTMYIKLHSRHSSRDKSHERNMSMSVRKFNSQSHHSLREIFIGNNQFKAYSKQILEKVSENQELIRIKFYVGKNCLSFQCIYQSHQGQVHSHQTNKDQEAGQQLELAGEVQAKYLFSMKFFFRSRMVGVECRIKTDKGTKNIHIGICDPHIEHELVTLVNRKIVTMGSFWHGKDMIGASLWFLDKVTDNKMRSSRRAESKKPQQTYEEYYT